MTNGKFVQAGIFFYIKSHWRNMFGWIQWMLKSDVPLKPQQMTLGEELFHGAFETP